MALVIGSVAADSGLTKAIYDEVSNQLSPPLQKLVDQATGDAKAGAQQTLDEARDGWRKLSFAVATGVIGHLLSNLEIRGVQTAGSVNAPVSGNCASAPPGPHQHGVSLAAVQPGVMFTQSNGGTGLVA